MRRINRIVVHCSATMEGKPFNAAAIDAMHKARGFKKIGYHYVVLLDGTIEKGRAESEVGAHAQGYNANSIGVCYIGGVGYDSVTRRVRGKDTRTPMQKEAMRNLIRQIKLRYPGARVMGHRDLSPDLNRDGKITSEEFIKECPCFNAMTEYDSVSSDTAKGGKLRDTTYLPATGTVDPTAPRGSVADAGGERVDETVR
jgi:N-acetylmuramoyl-L-alanine amidase